MTMARRAVLGVLGTMLPATVGTVVYSIVSAEPLGSALQWWAIITSFVGGIVIATWAVLNWRVAGASDLVVPHLLTSLGLIVAAWSWLASEIRSMHWGVATGFAVAVVGMVWVTLVTPPRDPGRGSPE